MVQNSKFENELARAMTEAAELAQVRDHMIVEYTKRKAELLKELREINTILESL